MARFDYYFIDLDGVLVDFTKGALSHHNRVVPYSEITWDFHKQMGLSGTEFWSPLGEHFWATLKPTEEFENLVHIMFNLMETEKVFLVSSPCLTLGCITGKARWVERYLPSFTRRLILTGDKHILAGPRKLLIDDNADNCSQWSRAGGQFFLFPRPWNPGNTFEPAAVQMLTELLKCGE